MKHSKIRQHIIETASQLFYSKGYNLTGINEIIATAEIAKATLYNHFKSKEDICIAYLQYKNATFLKDIEPFCLNKPKGADQVLAVFDFLMEFFNDKDFNGCWCIRTVSEIPKDNQRVKSEIQLQKNQFIQFIEKLIRANNLREEDNAVRMLAKHVYLLYESAVSESHLHQEKWPIQTAKAMCEKMID